MLGVRASRLRGRSLAAAAGVIALVAIALSPQFGRAEPTGNYRPDLPADALTNGCYPLPDGVTLDFPYQVRTDGDVGKRRHLLVQFDEIDADEAIVDLTAAFTEAGFSSEPTGTAGHLAFEKPGVGRVTADVSALPDVSADSIVRGTIAFDLPAIPVQSSSSVCLEPYSTKRFEPEAGS